MILLIAWRNVWRNKRRSLIVLTAIVIGLIAEIFMDGLMNGMMRQMLYNQIKLNTGHIQIHKSGFRVSKSAYDTIPDVNHIFQTLSEEGINKFSPRLYLQGIISSEGKSSGVIIYGVNPERENRTSVIPRSVINGEFPDSSGNNIAISEKISRRLSVTTGDKVSLLVNTGRIGFHEFNVSGIFKTDSPMFDKTTAFISDHSAQSFLHLGNNYHEISLIVNDFDKIVETKESLQKKFGNEYEVLSYRLRKLRSSSWRVNYD